MTVIECIIFNTCKTKLRAANKMSRISKNPIFWKCYLSALFLKNSAYWQVSENGHSLWVRGVPMVAVPHSRRPRFESRVHTKHFIYSLWPEVVGPGVRWLRVLIHSPNFTLTEKHFSNFIGIFQYCPKPLPLSYSDIGTKV